MKSPVCLAALLFASCSAGNAEKAAAVPKGADALASFEVVRAVLQSPRCVNCHPAGDAPLQGDDSHVHTQAILRGPEGRGMAGNLCLNCHGAANTPESYGPHQPPGISSGWRLPPPTTKMVFQGLASKPLCEQLKDPARNGGKDLGALVHHVTQDPLVLWGWAPGAGRAPVKLGHDDFVAAFKAWADNGAPCPAL